MHVTAQRNQATQIKGFAKGHRKKLLESKTLVLSSLAIAFWLVCLIH